MIFPRTILMVTLTIVRETTSKKVRSLVGFGSLHPRGTVIDLVRTCPCGRYCGIDSPDDSTQRRFEPVRLIGLVLRSKEVSPHRSYLLNGWHGSHSQWHFHRTGRLDASAVHYFESMARIGSRIVQRSLAISTRSPILIPSLTTG